MKTNFKEFSDSTTEEYYETMLSCISKFPQTGNEDGKIRYTTPFFIVIHSELNDKIIIDISHNASSKVQKIEVNLKAFKQFVNDYYSKVNYVTIEQPVSDDLLSCLSSNIQKISLSQANVNAIESKRIDWIIFKNVKDSVIDISKFFYRFLSLHDIKNCKIVGRNGTKITLIDCENLEYENNFDVCSINLSKLSKTAYPLAKEY